MDRHSMRDERDSVRSLTQIEPSSLKAEVDVRHGHRLRLVPARQRPRHALRPSHRRTNHAAVDAEDDLVLARALRAGRPDATWEIGHIGGHRFAATFLAFPWGLAFGRVPAARGPRVVDSLERGVIEVAWLRGRAGDAWAVQAADVHLRRELGLAGVDDVRVERVDGDEVSLRVDGRVVAAGVTRSEGAARPLSCGDEAESVPVANVNFRF